MGYLYVDKKNHIIQNNVLEFHNIKSKKFCKGKNFITPSGFRTHDLQTGSQTSCAEQ